MEITVKIPKYIVLESTIYEISVILRKKGMPISYKNFLVRYGQFSTSSDCDNNFIFKWRKV